MTSILWLFVVVATTSNAILQPRHTPITYPDLHQPKQEFTTAAHHLFAPPSTSTNNGKQLQANRSSVDHQRHHATRHRRLMASSDPLPSGCDASVTHCKACDPLRSTAACSVCDKGWVSLVQVEVTMQSNREVKNFPDGYPEYLAAMAAAGLPDMSPDSKSPCYQQVPCEPALLGCKVCAIIARAPHCLLCKADYTGTNEGICLPFPPSCGRNVINCKDCWPQKSSAVDQGQFPSPCKECVSPTYIRRWDSMIHWLQPITAEGCLNTAKIEQELDCSRPDWFLAQNWVDHENTQSVRECWPCSQVGCSGVRTPIRDIWDATHPQDAARILAQLQADGKLKLGWDNSTVIPVCQHVVGCLACPKGVARTALDFNAETVEALPEGGGYQCSHNCSSLNCAPGACKDVEAGFIGGCAACPPFHAGPASFFTLLTAPMTGSMSGPGDFAPPNNFTHFVNSCVDCEELRCGAGDHGEHSSCSIDGCIACPEGFVRVPSKYYSIDNVDSSASKARPVYECVSCEEDLLCPQRGACIGVEYGEEPKLNQWYGCLDCSLNGTAQSTAALGSPSTQQDLEEQPDEGAFVPVGTVRSYITGPANLMSYGYYWKQKLSQVQMCLSCDAAQPLLQCAPGACSLEHAGEIAPDPQDLIGPEDPRFGHVLQPKTYPDVPSEYMYFVFRSAGCTGCPHGMDLVESPLGGLRSCFPSNPVQEIGYSTSTDPLMLLWERYERLVAEGWPAADIGEDL